MACFGSDNGSGIPEELKDKIFVPNFTTKTSGMGLGLAMVKNIVEIGNGKSGSNLRMIKEPCSMSFFLLLEAGFLLTSKHLYR